MLNITEKYIACSNCGKKATHDTIINEEYVCGDRDCIIELAVAGYVNNELDKGDHEAYGEDHE